MAKVANLKVGLAGAVKSSCMLSLDSLQVRISDHCSNRSRKGPLVAMFYYLTFHLLELTENFSDHFWTIPCLRLHFREFVSRLYTEDGAKSPWTALKAPHSRIPVIS